MADGKTSMRAFWLTSAIKVLTGANTYYYRASKSKRRKLFWAIVRLGPFWQARHSSAMLPYFSSAKKCIAENHLAPLHMLRWYEVLWYTSWYRRLAHGTLKCAGLHTDLISDRSVTDWWSNIPHDWTSVGSELMFDTPIGTERLHALWGRPETVTRHFTGICITEYGDHAFYITLQVNEDVFHLFDV